MQAAQKRGTVGNAQAADQTCHLTLESKGGWVAAYTSSIVCCRIWEVSTELVASAILASKLTHARPRRPPALLAVQEALAPAQRLAAQRMCSAARTGRAGGSGSRQLCSRCTTPPSVPGRRTWALSTRSAARACSSATPAPRLNTPPVITAVLAQLSSMLSTASPEQATSVRMRRVLGARVHPEMASSGLIKPTSRSRADPHVLWAQNFLPHTARKTIHGLAHSS